jgi:hypothetical protein
MATPEARSDALRRDGAGALGDDHGIGHAIETVHQDDHVGGF